MLSVPLVSGECFLFILVLCTSYLNFHTAYFSGLMLWNQTRQQWVGSKKRHSRSQQPREPKLRWIFCDFLLSHLNECVPLSFLLWTKITLCYLISSIICNFLLMVYSWNTTYESLLGSNKPFSQPIPLGVRSYALLLVFFALKLS